MSALGSGAMASTWNLQNVPWPVKPFETPPRSVSPKHSVEAALVDVGTPQNLYSRTNFLGVPVEVRRMTWQQIHDDIVESNRKSWAARPDNPYEGVLLTCRQAYWELEEFWPLTIIKHNRVSKFALPEGYEGHFNFSSLTLEVPFDAGWKFFAHASQILIYLAPFIRDLRIFFVGRDKFGVATWLHGCGKGVAAISSISKKLAIDGQRHQERQPFFDALSSLGKLRSLTLSNCNYPILQSLILMNKPFLQQVHIESDPRSTLHRELNLSSLQSKGLLATQNSYFPPVEDLYIGANAALSSLHIASKCAATLRSLTWVVPDSSRQSGSLLMNWLENTAVLLQNLRMTNKNQLRVLRMCFEGIIDDGHSTWGIFMHGFKTHLPHLDGLRVVEIHMRTKSRWFGEEVVRALPKNVKRFYTSAEMISWGELQLALLAKCSTGQRVCPSCPLHAAKPDVRILPNHCGGSNMTIDGIVGDVECRDCTASIMFRGSLGFVGFEWLDNRTWTEKQQRIDILILNGKLLDRERNAHLKPRHEGVFIGARTRVEAYKVGGRTWPTSEQGLQVRDSTSEPPEHSKEELDRYLRKLERAQIKWWPRCESWLNDLEKTNASVTDETARALPALNDGQTFNDKSELERQCTASEVFADEIAAQWKDLSPLKYVEVVEVGQNEHWLTD